MKSALNSLISKPAKTQCISIGFFFSFYDNRETVMKEFLYATLTVIMWATLAYMVVIHLAGGQ